MHELLPFWVVDKKVFSHFPPEQHDRNSNRDFSNRSQLTWADNCYKHWPFPLKKVNGKTSLWNHGSMSGHAGDVELTSVGDQPDHHGDETLIPDKEI